MPLLRMLKQPKKNRCAVGEAGHQNKLNFEPPCDLNNPCTFEPILPALCKKNDVFRFISSSASETTHSIY